MSTMLCYLMLALIELVHICFTEVDLNHRHPALDIYCGVGLTVGFLGVATGTFLIVKGRYSQTFGF